VGIHPSFRRRGAVGAAILRSDTAMKHILFATALALPLLLTACDPQSGITKKSLEKYNPSPTPPINIPTPETIAPADVVTVDTNLAGPNINVNKPEEGKKVKCDKYNRVMINGDSKEVNIEGACKQIMINGEGSKVTVTAVSEVVFNGTDNKVEFYKYVNGKHPIVNDNAGASTVTHVPQPDPSPKPGK
jgi:hypothetical protein